MNSYHEHILIVEDDKQIQRFIGYALDTAGFPHTSATTGENALNLLVSEPIDLMLLDLGLPDFDGMEVIRKVREWSQMPIIVVSARDQDKEKVAALDLGADDYLTKPFSASNPMSCALGTGAATTCGVPTPCWKPWCWIWMPNNGAAWPHCCAPCCRPCLCRLAFANACLASTAEARWSSKPARVPWGVMS